VKFSSKWIGGILVVSAAIALAPSALAKKAKAIQATASADEAFLALRDAVRRDDGARSSELSTLLANYDIPSYVDYYRLKSHFRNASESEIRDFLVRYDGSAIADRLRNDWLLDLGYRRDWQKFDEQYPHFALNDDFQLKCYALTSKALKGQPVADDARALLVSPKDYGDACNGLIATLAENAQFNSNDLWAQVRLAAETNAASVARRTAALMAVPDASLLQALEVPAVALAHGVGSGRNGHELYLIALGQLARSGPPGQAQAAQALLATGTLTAMEQAIGWAQIAHPASVKLSPEALGFWRRANGAPLSPEAQQWKVRTALRAGDWGLVKATVEAMPVALRADPAWTYWLARALKADGGPADSEDALTAQALLHSIADQTNFYGQLALEELGQKITIPPAGQALTPTEIAPMASNPGFRRALKFFSLGLRFEGTREWNWELRRLSEREHLAAAEFARQNNILDRMVSTSDRTKSEFDFTQRYPSPHHDIMRPATQSLGLDKAWVYGLIRQESRFIMNARSSVGASGLMQLMPATARYVAHKIGLGNFVPGQVNDVSTNILLGANYLNMVLTNLDGSQTMATAAYNAGPGRPRAWRASLTRPVEGAIFAESIPFTETRGYVKNVLSNATYYAALFDNKPQSLRARLGTIAPKDAGATDLP
jgi:soluble lytic murein transglycosylase